MISIAMIGPGAIGGTVAAWLALRSFGNAGLWGALLVHYAARGGRKTRSIW